MEPYTIHDSIDAQTMKTELIRLLCQKSFKMTDEPSFKLVSGRMSRYYVNCKPTTLSPRGMFLTGHLVFDAIRSEPVSAAGGLTFGADPIAMATAFVSELYHHPIQAFSIRKTQKDHGMIRWVEGDIQPGERVAVLEDVVTTGGSTLQAIERARQSGLDVVVVVVLVDREEGGLEAIRREVPHVRVIVTRSELEREMNIRLK
ncbi:MAG: orotate phosphoribosyltransferase [Thermodesulfobacteriota bacterium]